MVLLLDIISMDLKNLRVSMSANMECGERVKISVATYEEDNLQEMGILAMSTQ